MKMFLFVFFAACLLMIPALYSNMPFDGHGVAQKEPIFGSKLMQAKLSHNGGIILLSSHPD